MILNNFFSTLNSEWDSSFDSKIVEKVRVSKHDSSIPSLLPVLGSSAGIRISAVVLIERQVVSFRNPKNPMVSRGYLHFGLMYWLPRSRRAYRVHDTMRTSCV